MIISLFVIFIAFSSFVKSLTDIVVVSNGLIPIENANSEYLQWDSMNSYSIASFFTNANDFSVSFSGWIDAGPEKVIPVYQSKI